MKTAVLLATCLLAAPCSHAENKLFPTDILEKEQVDISASAQYENYSYGLNFSGAKGNESSTFTDEKIEIRYGLGANWYIKASTSYTSRGDIKTKWKTGEQVINNDYEGKNNPYFSATYGIINDTQNPFSLSISASVSPKTTDTPSSYLATLSGGWKKSETLKLYSTITTTIFNDRDHADKVDLRVGAFQEVSSNVTIKPYVEYGWYNSTSWGGSSSYYIIGIGSQFQMQKNTYLTAAIANYGVSSLTLKDAPQRVDSTNNGLMLSFGLYHLF